MRAITIDVDTDEVIRIGADTVIKLIQKSGRRARLEIHTDYKVRHDRTAAPPRPGNPGPASTPVIQRPK